jgi:hypothetical protein
VHGRRGLRGILRVVCEGDPVILARVTRRSELPPSWECFGSCLGGFLGAVWEGNRLRARSMTGVSGSPANESASPHGPTPWNAGLDWFGRSMGPARRRRGRPGQSSRARSLQTGDRCPGWRPRGFSADEIRRADSYGPNHPNVEPRHDRRRRSDPEPIHRGAHAPRVLTPSDDTRTCNKLLDVYM